jgi:hypothetical protein
MNKRDSLIHLKIDEGTLNALREEALKNYRSINAQALMILHLYIKGDIKK